MGSSTFVVHSQGTWSISASPHQAEQWLTYLCSCRDTDAQERRPSVVITRKGTAQPVLMGH